MKLRAFVITFASFASLAAFAGTPAQDAQVRRLQTDFRSALATYPAASWNFTPYWSCQSHDAFTGDFYSEPDMTFILDKLSAGSNTLVNTGSIIFKELNFTKDGIQSVKYNEAYCNNPVYLTLRPIFSYKPDRSVKDVRLVGEVSVDDSILGFLATYYGYSHPFTGVHSDLSATRTIYYYLECRPSTAQEVVDQAAINATWSIPAELSRTWPGCTNCH